VKRFGEVSQIFVIDAIEVGESKAFGGSKIVDYVVPAFTVTKRIVHSHRQCVGIVEVEFYKLYSAVREPLA
jgi:hypothetical protein